MIDKQTLRSRALARLRDMITQERDLASMSATQHASQIPQIGEARTILLFAPMMYEPDTWPLTDLLLSEKKRILLPALSENGIVPCEYRVDDILVNSSYGVLEPDTRYAVDASSIEVALIPGVAFDEKGHRLGRGKGHYDRFLESLDCIKIGLCYEIQIERAVPCEPHDVIMDAVCTDKRLILCNDRVSPMYAVRRRR